MKSEFNILRVISLLNLFQTHFNFLKVTKHIALKATDIFLCIIKIQGISSFVLFGHKKKYDWICL